jgi:hypothetical protein
MDIKSYIGNSTIYINQRSNFRRKPAPEQKDGPLRDGRYIFTGRKSARKTHAGSVTQRSGSTPRFESSSTPRLSVHQALSQRSRRSCRRIHGIQLLPPMVRMIQTQIQTQIQIQIRTRTRTQTQVRNGTITTTALMRNALHVTAT